MSKKWTAMTVQVVGQLSEVVQSSQGKYSPIADDGGLSMSQSEPM